MLLCGLEKREEGRSSHAIKINITSRMGVDFLLPSFLTISTGRQRVARPSLTHPHSLNIDPRSRLVHLIGRLLWLLAAPLHINCITLSSRPADAHFRNKFNGSYTLFIVHQGLHICLHRRTHLGVLDRDTFQKALGALGVWRDAPKMRYGRHYQKPRG